MKNFLLFVIILAFSNNLYSQKKCFKCNTNEVSQKYLNQYLGNISIIKENWNEFLGEDLDSKLPCPISGINLMSIKFDGMGCVYPDFFSNNIKNDFKANDKLNNKAFKKNTFYSIVHQANLSKIDKFNKKIPNQSEKLKSVLNERNNSIFGPKEYADSYFRFIEYWNSEFLSIKIKEIEKTVINKNIKKVVFIVHGYNLPFSLAHVQANNLIEFYSKNSSDLKTTLFIKIYWPSLSAKKPIIENANFRFRNRIKFSTIKEFSYIINRSYLAGFSIRQLINSLDGKVESVDLIGHSMGCPTISAAFINPISKLNIKKDTSSINKNFKLIFEKTPLHIPKLKVNVFLNAAAMSGVWTFDESNLNKNDKIEEQSIKNISWTIGFNPDDKVLRKTIGIHFGDINGNTRLGGNWENEVWKTKDYIQSLGKTYGNFDFVRTGYQRDQFGHDFFCYLNQADFQSALSKFINKN